MAKATRANDEPMTMTDYRESTANGNALELWGQGTERDSAARQVAAALPRDMEGLQKVESGIEHPATVWMEPAEAGTHKPRRFEAPEGWRIARVDVYRSGRAAYDLEADR